MEGDAEMADELLSKLHSRDGAQHGAGWLRRPLCVVALTDEGIKCMEAPLQRHML